MVSCMQSKYDLSTLPRSYWLPIKTKLPYGPRTFQNALRTLDIYYAPPPPSIFPKTGKLLSIEATQAPSTWRGSRVSTLVLSCDFFWSKAFALAFSGDLLWASDPPNFSITYASFQWVIYYVNLCGIEMFLLPGFCLPLSVFVGWFFSYECYSSWPRSRPSCNGFIISAL